MASHLSHTDMIVQFNVPIYTSPDRWYDRTILIAMTQFHKIAGKHTVGLE